MCVVQSHRSFLLLLSFLLLVGCNPSDSQDSNAYPAFSALEKSVMPILRISPALAEYYHTHVIKAQIAAEQGDTEQIIQELNALLKALSKLPNNEAANLAALDLVNALDQDLAQMMSTRKRNKLTTTHHWNMQCSPNFTCQIARGFYCRQLLLDGKAVGCSTGRMPKNIAPSTTPIQ